MEMGIVQFVRKLTLCALIFWIHFCLGSIGGSIDRHSVVAETPWDEALVGPSFDRGSPEEVTVSVGQTAYMTCRVRQLGDRKVSWIRQRDLHILTVGQLSYTNDVRFSVIKAATGDTWTLRIRSVQLRDAGTYECQISSEPKISKLVRLNVVVSEAVIHGSPEVYVRAGSDINLTCVAKQMPEPPSHFTWYRGSHVLNYGTPATNGSSKVTYHTGHYGMESYLLIKNAIALDSGNFTCIPAGAEPASIVVHVLNGEHPAAMQHGHNGTSRLSTTYCFLIISSLYLSLFIRRSNR